MGVSHRGSWDKTIAYTEIKGSKTASLGCNSKEDIPSSSRCGHGGIYICVCELTLGFNSLAEVSHFSIG